MRPSGFDTQSTFFQSGLVISIPRSLYSANFPARNFVSRWKTSRSELCALGPAIKSNVMPRGSPQIRRAFSGVKPFSSIVLADHPSCSSLGFKRALPSGSSFTTKRLHPRYSLTSQMGLNQPGNIRSSKRSLRTTRSLPSG